MLELTVQKLGAHPGLRTLAVSRWYRTPPMRGGTALGWFANGVALFDCALSLDDLLATTRALEEASGRRRSRHWGDRTLDLDVLLAAGARREDSSLTVPHPGIAQRSFVLYPLLEVWPDAVDERGLRYADFAEPDMPRPAPIGIMPRPKAR